MRQGTSMKGRKLKGLLSLSDLVSLWWDCMFMWFMVYVWLSDSRNLSICLVSAKTNILNPRRLYSAFSIRTLSLPSSTWAFPQPFEDKRISEVVRIGSIIIFYLNKVWKAMLFILCDVIFLVRLQRGDLKLISLWVKGLNMPTVLTIGPSTHSTYWMISSFMRWHLATVDTWISIILV